jgi:hypothetical protein
MRRLAGLLSLVFLFVGCGDPTYYAVSISNSSSKTVSYTYDHNSDTLDPGSFMDYQVKAYTPEPADINIVPPGTLSVRMNRKTGALYVFEDVEPINLHVSNVLPFSVTLKAGDYIDADGTGEMRLAVPANSEVMAVIYTSKPQFTITAEYPTSIVTVEWELDTENDTLYVIIK